MTNAFMSPLGHILRDYYELADWGRAEAEYACRKGLPLEALNAHCGGFAIVPAAFDGGGGFRFDQGGEPAAVIEVYGDDDATAVDLAAWPVARPEIFGTALGLSAILGEARVTNPATWAFGELLRVHRTPLSWCRAGCAGVVILHHKWSGPILADALGPLLAEDEDHARSLAMMLSPLVPAHLILFPKSARAAA